MFKSVASKRFINLRACLRNPAIKFRYGIREQHHKLENKSEISTPPPKLSAHSVQTIEVIDEFDLPLRFKRKPIDDIEINYINRGGPDDDEWDDAQEPSNTTESLAIKFGILKEENYESSKLDNFHRNLHYVVIDEICLEGLDGITLEALWLRLSVALNFPLPFPTNVMNFFWNIIISRTDIEFFKLNEPRPALVIFDRFNERDSDLGEIMDPIEAPLDIYPYSPVNGTDVLGSASSFATRIDVSEEVRGLCLDEVQKKYGACLVLVGTQKMRQNAICNCTTDPLIEFTSMQYCLLERIARSRFLGEITQGKVSLNVMSKDPKVIFYNRKILAEHNLITKQPFNIKTSNVSHLSGTLFHIVRFYKEQKTKTIRMTQQIVEFLRNKPNYRSAYSEVKKTFGHVNILKKLFKLQEFQKYVRTDVPCFCRELYLNDCEKWFCVGSNKEKVVRTLELVDPNIIVSGNLCDDDVKDESSDEETTEELMFKIPILHQFYDFIRRAGPDGCSLKEIQTHKGLDFYSTRAAVNQLLNQKVITGVKIDVGRQRLMKYQISQYHLETTYQEKEEETKQLESDAIDFVANLLEIEPQYITTPFAENSLSPRINESEYSNVKRLRQQSKQNPESAETLTAIYRNHHDYVENKQFLSFNCEGKSISKDIAEGVIQSWYYSDNNYVKKKPLPKFYQQIKQINSVNDLYIQNIVNIQCPLVYQSLMCEESYRNLLKNASKVSRVLFSNCKYLLNELPPRKRYMFKQQLPWDELQAFAEAEPFLGEAQVNSHPASKRKLESNEDSTKRLRLDEETTATVKDMYMGPKPTLAYEDVDAEDIHVAVWVSTTPEEFSDTYLPYIKEHNATLRTVQRANSILDAVKRESVITDIFRLHKVIQSQEQEEGYNVKVDRKSFQRIYARLVRNGLIKILQIILKSVNTRRVVTVLCDTSLDVRHSLIQSVIEQLKMKIFVPKKKISEHEVSQKTSEVKTFDTTKITSSVGELKMLADNDYEYVPNRTVGREYGYVSKFLRMRVLHEFLFYVIYNYTTEQEVKDPGKMLAESDVIIDEDEIKELPTIYCRGINWKMFIPPLTNHSDWPNGWALVCDILLRLPLSLFVKLCNVTLVIPDLHLYLEHPVKQHYLVKYLPNEVRSGLLHRRKYIFSIHETLCQLAYIGLLQFGPQKLREKDQVFIYLNRNASLYDTTTTSVGYHYVEDKEYKKNEYHFITSTDVETYWYEMWNICTHSNLGMRNAVVGTYITIEHLETKPAMLDTLKPQTPESALVNDNGHIPGDHRGAAGLDSALWSHIKRNWVVSAQSPNRQATKTQQQVKIKKLAKSKKEQLEKQIKNKKVPLSVGKSRKSVVIRKVHRVEMKGKKKGYDCVDKKLMENLKHSRSEWTYEEDILLNICKLISTFLCPNYRKQLIYYTVIRDTLHCLVPCSINKTSGACQRRLNVLFGSIEQQEYLQQIAKALKCIPFVQKYFQKFYDYVQNGMFLKEKQLLGAFVLLVVYFFENQHELHHIFETINSSNFKTSKSKVSTPFTSNVDFTVSKRDNEMNVLAYEGLENVSRPNKNPKLYPDASTFPKSENDVILDTIKSIIHSTVAVKSNDASCVYQLFRVYQGYPDELLKAAVTEVRNSQMIIAKRTTKKQADMKGLPITSKLFHFSFYYGFAQVTKFPVELFQEAHEFLLGIHTHRDKLLPSSGTGLPTECFQQGHVIGLSEVVTNIAANFIVDFPKEVLILNPRIADHTELIRELAVRYKKMLTLVKDGSYFKDDQQNESTEKHFNRSPMIQRFLKTWFLTNDKDEEEVENVNLAIVNTENSKETAEHKRKFMSSSQQILKSFNEDIHQHAKKSQEKLRTVYDESSESFEDYEKKLENLLSSKSSEATAPVVSNVNSVFTDNIFKGYLSKGKELVGCSQASSVCVENVRAAEPDSVLNARITSIINDDLSVEDVMKEMLDESPSEERKVPNVIKLSRLLVKGLFPDLDEDEERLEKLHQHFLVVCPDTNLTIDDFEDNDTLNYLHKLHPLVCKNLLHKVQKDIIVNENFPKDEEIVIKCKSLEYSEEDISEIKSLIDFVLKKKVLGASIGELKGQFPNISSTKLSNFLKTLMDMNVIFRTGIIYILFVHCRHRKHWLVESCALEYQDKMKLEQSNVTKSSDLELPALAKSFDSYTEMKLNVKPWARIDGTLNLKLFEKWLCTILGHCLADACISLKAVINTCNFLKPVDVYYLVECLQDIGCLKMVVYPSQTCCLTTEFTYIESFPATIVDEFEDIFIDVDQLAIVKFGTLLNKKFKEFDFPTDAAQKHGTF
ncbi:hypothetical protein FQR65_LT03191 [Abscondita terminalis]|nr:hypothetical protein FQR65_LT03191 [Abscondita terminalis]